MHKCTLYIYIYIYSIYVGNQRLGDEPVRAPWARSCALRQHEVPSDGGPPSGPPPRNAPSGRRVTDARKVQERPDLGQLEHARLPRTAARLRQPARPPVAGEDPDDLCGSDAEEGAEPDFLLVRPAKLAESVKLPPPWSSERARPLIASTGPVEARGRRGGAASGGRLAQGRARE